MSEETEYLKELRKEIAEAQRDKHIFEKLQSDPGWIKLIEIIGKHQSSVEREIVYTEGLSERECDIRRGEAMTFRFFANLPKMIAEDCEQTLSEGDGDVTTE